MQLLLVCLSYIFFSKTEIVLLPYTNLLCCKCFKVGLRPLLPEDCFVIS